MSNDPILMARLILLESKISAIDVRLSAIENGGKSTSPSRKFTRRPWKANRKQREWTIKQRRHVRDKMMEGKERKRREREGQVRSQIECDPALLGKPIEAI